MECSHYACNELHLCLTSPKAYNVCVQSRQEQVDVCEEVQLDDIRDSDIFHFNEHKK